MYLLNVTHPFLLLAMLVMTLLLIFLAKELKKSAIAVIPLFVSLGILVIHVVQLTMFANVFEGMLTLLCWCISMDFIFVLITFFAYLWVDDIESKEKGRKSMNNCLKWLWKKV